MLEQADRARKMSEQELADTNETLYTKRVKTQDAGEPLVQDELSADYLKSLTHDQLQNIKEQILSRATWIDKMDMGNNAPFWAQVRMLRIIELYPEAFSKKGVPVYTFQNVQKQDSDLVYLADR